MFHRTLLCLAALSWLSAAGLATPSPASAEDAKAVTLLLPPGATEGFERGQALSALKSELREAGFDITAQGEFNPDQKLELVEKGLQTGLIAHGPGDEVLAEKLQLLLGERYPDVLVEPAPKRNNPFPEGALGLILPEIVILEKEPERLPPPYKLYLEDVTVAIDGGMSAADVRGLFEDHKEDLIACWPKAQARGKQLEGLVKAKVTVDPGGEPVISSVLESPGYESWVDCVTEAYLGWKFPATTDGKSAKVEIGVRFVPFGGTPDTPAEPEEPAPEPADEAPAAE